MRSTLFLAAAAVAMAAGSVPAVAKDVMIQPTDAVIIAGGPGFGSIVNTYNQAGLSAGYVSGVTPTMPYLATTTHTNAFPCCEWFSESGSTTATVSYEAWAPKKVKWIDSFELWNEESSGIGVFDLWHGAFAGDLGTLLLAGISPTDNPLGPPYLADVYSIMPKKGGWYTLVMSKCPQPVPGSFPSCAIGEVAFNGPLVPEPGTWAMLIAGFGLMGTALRRRRAALARA